MTNNTEDSSTQDPDLVEQHEELLREASRSREGAELLSPWLVVGFLAVAFLGAGYLFWNSGGFKVTVFNPARVAWDGSGSGGPAAAPDPMVIGNGSLRKIAPFATSKTALELPDNSLRLPAANGCFQRTGTAIITS